jgi:hypothetical protein
MRWRVFIAPSLKIFVHLNFEGKDMKKIIRVFAICALIAIGAISVMTAASTAASAQGQSSKGVFVSSIQPGIITAISDNHITIKNGADEVFDIIVARNTRFDREGQPIKLADIHVGDSLGAGGWLNGKTLRALAVTIGDGKTMQSLFDNQRKVSEGTGKTNVMGNVKAIDGNKLTVERSDKVVQVIAVDENTSIHKAGRTAPTAAQPHGETITLADVKVGDMVVAVGSVENDVFVAKGLTVIEVR